jgi:ubiquinone/menaquinone biosynthesis C-methylase UbiE
VNSALLDLVLKPDAKAEQVDLAIWSVLPEVEREAPYDRMARAYDWLIGNTIYNRLVWGNWSKLYRDAAADALKAPAEGPILDCGCGSLIFTSAAYQSALLSRMILFDRSLGMMRRGAKRLEGGTFLQGDALALPFADASFGLCLSWGLAHIFGSESELFAELRRVTQPGGLVKLSTLVLAGRSPGDSILPQLHKRGEIAQPETANTVRQAFARHFSIEADVLRGNMLFLTGRRIGDSSGMKLG